MRLLVWLVRAAVFFTLFAFALNNREEATIHWFFSYAWTAPLVIIVLIAFACGAVFGVLAMTPSWWRHRRAARRLDAPSVAAVPATPAAPPAPDVTVVRDGL